MSKVKNYNSQKLADVNVKNIHHKKFLKNIFSIVNSYNLEYKILTVLGLKFAFKYKSLKLGVSYNLFDGEELLEASILSIRDAVDYINVVYQNTSYYGQKANSKLEEQLLELKEKGLIDEIYLYDKNFSLKDKTIYEKAKRDIGLNLAREAGCTHFLNMDVDEFYDKDEIIKAKEFILKNNIKMTAVPIYEYLKSPEFRFVDSYSFTNGHDKYSYYVPFIIKIDKKSSYKKSKFFPCLVDPTRTLNNSGKFYLFSKQDVIMHHMSTIRTDIDKKYNNSNYNNSAVNSEFLSEIKQNIRDWDFNDHQIGTSQYSTFQNKLVVKVKNKFNINL
jgi:hypothetical protein